MITINATKAEGDTLLEALDIADRGRVAPKPIDGGDRSLGRLGASFGKFGWGGVDGWWGPEEAGLKNDLAVLEANYKNAKIRLCEFPFMT